MEKINYKDLQCNPFSLVNRMMLLTAGNQEVGYNVMTISWGGFGVLWDKPVATIYVRPSRHTMNFLNQCDHFTLSVLSDEYKKHMVYCGTVSGVRLGGGAAAKQGKQGKYIQKIYCALHFRYSLKNFSSLSKGMMSTRS